MSKGSNDGPQKKPKVTRKEPKKDKGRIEKLWDFMSGHINGKPRAIEVWYAVFEARHTISQINHCMKEQDRLVRKMQEDGRRMQQEIERKYPSFNQP